MASGSLGSLGAVSTPVFVGPNQSLTADLTGTWVGRVVLERSDSSGLSYSPILGLPTFRQAGSTTRTDPGLYRYRFREYTSGTANYVLTAAPTAQSGAIVATLATLPAASSVPIGTNAYTTDSGPVYSDGTSWHATGGAGGSTDASTLTSGTLAAGRLPALTGDVTTSAGSAVTTLAAGVVPVGANPSTSVGLTVVNGAATTFMRSDAAPALDVSIAPTWSGAHTFSNVAGISAPALNIAASGTAPASVGLYQSAASTVSVRTSSGNQLTINATAVTVAPPLTSQGLVTANVGINTRKGSVTISASERVKVGGVSYTNTTTTGNTAATETDAFSHSVTGATLGTDGESLEFQASGSIAATANTDKRVKVKWGATTIFDTGAMAITAASSWVLRCTIIRTGAATQKTMCTFTTSSSVVPALASYATAAETLASASTLRLTLNGTSASDVVGEFYKEQWLPFQ